MTLTPSSSRGGVSTAREQFSGNNVAVYDGATGDLTWNTHSGDALLNVTAPARPTIVAAGVYAFAMTVQGAPFVTPGGYFVAAVELDVQDEDATQLLSSPPASATLTTVYVQIGFTYYLAAGAELLIRVTNHDGAGQILFLHRTVIQRLS